MCNCRLPHPFFFGDSYLDCVHHWDCEITGARPNPDGTLYLYCRTWGHIQFDVVRKRHLDRDQQIKLCSRSPPLLFSLPASQPLSPMTKARGSPRPLLPPPMVAKLFSDLSFPVTLAFPRSQAPATTSMLAALTCLSTGGAPVPAPAALWVDASDPCPDHAAKLHETLTAVSQQVVLVVQRETATSEYLDHLEAELVEGRKRGHSKSCWCPCRGSDHGLSYQSTQWCSLLSFERNCPCLAWPEDLLRWTPACLSFLNYGSWTAGRPGSVSISCFVFGIGTSNFLHAVAYTQRDRWDPVMSHDGVSHDCIPRLRSHLPLPSQSQNLCSPSPLHDGVSHERMSHDGVTWQGITWQGSCDWLSHDWSSYDKVCHDFRQWSWSCPCCESFESYSSFSSSDSWAGS